MMERLPFGCQVKMPPGIVCRYRALTNRAITDHERSHAACLRSINSNKSRYYECEDNVHCEKVAICGHDGQVIFVNKEFVEFMAKKRIDEMKPNINSPASVSR